MKVTAIKKTVDAFFNRLGIAGETAITETEELIDIVLDTPDSGMVIGYHGDMLESLQLILALCLAKDRGVYQRVSIEVGEYKKNRSDYLLQLAMSTKERVLSESREIALPELKSWERRVIHMLLSDDKDVLSESVGMGKDRTLVIKPKN